MAFYDPIEQRMCVRIVYDGIAGTGKTTNLRMLCELFATQRKTELVSPGEVDGRTVLFDWVQILAGAICGFPLMCQVITVPGQVVLTPRRRYLLASADVVVFVSDSASPSLGRTRDALSVLHEVHGSKQLVLQANKQDQADAIPGAELARRLALGGVPVTEAIASEGIGVVDTFVLAVRTISRAMQAEVERGELRLDVRRAAGAAELETSVARRAIDPEWAAEMALEEALTALLVEGVPAPGVAERHPGRSVEPRAAAGPVLPHADVPTGFIWPAHTGREKLRALASRGALDRCPSLDAEGRIRHRVQGSVFATSVEHRFASHEDVRQALICAARERTQLGPALVADTILVAQAASDAWWLWSIVPDVPTITEAMATAVDPDRIASAFAAGAAEALAAALRHGFLVELDPGCFGWDGSGVRYLGTVRSSPLTERSIEDALGAAVHAFVPRVRGSILRSFATELERRLAEPAAERVVAALRAVEAEAE
jgi:signal recognition particle receptor subunit beta